MQRPKSNTGGDDKGEPGMSADQLTELFDTIN